MATVRCSGPVDESKRDGGSQAKRSKGHLIAPFPTTTTEHKQSSSKLHHQLLDKFDRYEASDPANTTHGQRNPLELWKPKEKVTTPNGDEINACERDDTAQKPTRINTSTTIRGVPILPGELAT